MDNNLLSPSQLSSYSKPTSVALSSMPQNNGGLLTPSQLASYATKSNPSNPTSAVGSSWDAFDKAIKQSSNSTASNSLTPNMDKADDGTTILGDIGKSMQTHGQNIVDDISNTQQGKDLSLGEVGKSVVNDLSTAGHVAGNIAGTVGDMFGSVLSHVVPENIKSGFGDYIGFVADKLNQVPGMTDKLNSINSFMDKNPDMAKSISDVFNTVSLLGGEKGEPVAKEGLSKGLSEGQNIASDIKTGIVDPALDKVKSIMPEAKPSSLDEKSVIDGYNRSIKPSIIGKSTATQIAQANERTLTGLKSIVNNKAGLEFTDESGNPIQGQTPKTVQQTSEAIQQTKSSIFKQYDALAKQAGQKGIAVDAPSIAKELQPVIDSKSLNITNPETVAYAKQLQQRLTEQGSIDAQTAQEVIKNYNEELKTYYRNPTPGAASRVQVDAMIANKFRANLDEGITEMTGTQYQDLKNQYGALSSMEKDVARRAATVAKQSKVGLVANLSNIASGAELVRGLMTGNPVDIGISATMKGIELYNKYLNNPDVGIQKMFSEIERSNPSPKGTIPPGSESQIKDASPKPTTFQPKSKIGKFMQDASKANNKQGGYITIGGKTFNEIPEATKQEMIKTIDYLRVGKNFSGAEDTVSNLTQKYNISPDLPSGKIADKLEKLIENTKTSQAKVRQVLAKNK